MPTRMDSMLSRGLGKVKAAKARLSGLVGVFQTLSEQHGEARALLERARSSDEKFAELWPTIRRELLSHERAETREVFPALRMHAETRALADDHDADAAELEGLIERVNGLAAGAEERRRAYAELIETVQRHVTQEERETFPLAQRTLGKARTEALDASFRAAKQQIAEAI